MSEKKIRLSMSQKRIWYTKKLFPNDSIHTIGGTLYIDGKVDFPIINKAVNFLFETNEALRVDILEDNENVIQVIQDYSYKEIDFKDFSEMPNPEEEFKKWSNHKFEKFHKNNELFKYFCICKLADCKYNVLVCLDHIISDGWSINILFEELIERIDNYEQKIKKTNDRLYENFIEDEYAYQKTKRYIKNRTYWNSAFNNLEELLINSSSKKLEGSRSRFYVDSILMKEINEYVSKKNISVNLFFITCLYIYLSKTSKENVIALPIYNRTGPYKNLVGMFTNILPVVFSVNPFKSVNEIYNEVNSVLKKSMINHKYPYDYLLRDLSEKNGRIDRLYNITFNYHNTKFSNSSNDINTRIEELYAGSQTYSLQMSVNQWEQDNTSIVFDYKINDYSENDIEYFYNSYVTLIKNILLEPNLKVKEYKIESDEGIENKLTNINDTSINYPKGKSIYHLFNEIVLLEPKRVAIKWNGKMYTYRELSERVQNFSEFLRYKGIKLNSRVAVIANNSPELIIMLLAIIKCEGTFIPIDANLPKNRIKYILDDAEPNLILTNTILESEVTNNRNYYNYYEVVMEKYTYDNFDVPIDNTKWISYILYTSGSTGKPKGVLIKNESIINYINWAKKSYINGREVFPLFTSISFDLTLTSIFTPLISGSTLKIIDESQFGYSIIDVFMDEELTIIKLTPSHLKVLKELEIKKTSLKLLIVGGEELDVKLARNIYQKFKGNIKIINEYGPTEATVGCTYYCFNFNDSYSSVPIGKPIDNMEIYILDGDNNIAANDVIGEICIAGVGVSAGYLNDPKLTANNFVSNFFKTGDVLYRTGDLGKYSRTGDIIYIGRKDSQIKVNGYRIEVKEIESVLLNNPLVKEVYVGVLSRKENIISAYIVKKSESLTLEQIKHWLLEYLPIYMVPKNINFIDKIPLNINGKVDTSYIEKLDKQQFSAINKDNDIETLNSKEKILLKVIKEIFLLEHISIYDSFFEIGGDSIKAIQTSAKLKSENIDLLVQDILKLDTLREIAKKMEYNDKKENNQDICSGTIEKTPIINWFFSLEDDNKNHWVQSVLIKLKFNLTTSQINNIIEVLIKHHDMLRANYNREKECFYYNNTHFNNKGFVEEYDLSNLNYLEQNKRIIEIGKDIKSSFEIENSLLFKTSILNLGDNNKLILFVAHHLVIDGLSWRVILEDFSNTVLLMKEKKPLVLPSKTQPFQSWAKSLLQYKGKINKEIKEYWSNLDDIKPFKKNFDVVTYNDISTVNLAINDTKLHSLKKLQEIYKMNLNELLIFLFVYSLKEHNKNQSVSMDIETHGRDLNLDVSRTVGWFTNFYNSTFDLNKKNLKENLKYFKEVYRGVPNNGLEYGLLSNSFQGFIDNSRGDFRYNYLGDFDNASNSVFSFLNIDTGEDIALSNNFYYLIDIVGMKLNNEINFSLSFSEKNISFKNVINLTETFNNNLDYLVDSYDTDEIVYSRSDFKEVSISQDELDIIFDT